MLKLAQKIFKTKLTHTVYTSAYILVTSVSMISNPLDMYVIKGSYSLHINMNRHAETEDRALSPSCPFS